MDRGCVLFFGRSGRVVVLGRGLRVWVDIGRGNIGILIGIIREGIMFRGWLNGR